MLRRVSIVVAGNILMLGGLLLLFEGALYLLFLFPFHPSILVAARDYHLGYARQNPMYLPECAMHDRRMAYRLKQQECSFTGREFSTRVRGNSIGVRGDEASLSVPPEIVVLGDSQAFGWGVEEDAAFPAVLQRTSGKKVANLSLPSFGTVRELRMLKRVNLDKVTDIVIQYSDNDHEENRAFVGNRNKLITMPRQTYEKHVQRSAAESIEYYPGKLTQRFLPLLVKRVGKSIRGEAPRYWTGSRNLRAESRQLLHVLRWAPISLAKYRLWITEVASFGEHEPAFLRTLMEEFEKLPPDQKADIGPLRTIDLSKALGPEHYFVYDDHLNEMGHQVVASQIQKALGGASLAIPTSIE